MSIIADNAGDGSAEAERRDSGLPISKADRDTCRLKYDCDGCDMEGESVSKDDAIAGSIPELARLPSIGRATVAGRVEVEGM